MTRLQALIAKLREDRGNLTIVIGVTLLTIVVATMLTMNTAVAAALMKSGETASSIRSVIADTKTLAFARLVGGQGSVKGVSSELPGVRAYVSDQTSNASNSTVTLTIVGESLNDNVNLVTTEVTYARYQANFFAGFDKQGVPIWIATPTTGTGSSPSPYFTGYKKGSQ